MFIALVLLSATLWLAAANAHLAAFHKGMYCINGPQSTQDLNSNAIVTPLYQLSYKDWWLHHVDGCDNYPPADGDFLELPAGGSFTVEIASNRAKTTLSYDGRDISDWPDGNAYPDDYNVPSCIVSPNMHTQNQSMVSGSAFAISYQSDITKVTPENLVVFSVRYNSPWKRVVSFDVPAAMPSCPPGGCICAWGWIPNGCGQPNMYQQPLKCQVTSSKSVLPVAAAKPAVWCEGNPSACRKGAKQMLYWNQLEGNNIVVAGYDQAGRPNSPGYTSKCGFSDGAQNDIFISAPTSGPSSRTIGTRSASSSASFTVVTSTAAITSNTPTTTTTSPKTSTSSSGNITNSISKTFTSATSVVPSPSPSNIPTSVVIISPSPTSSGLDLPSPASSSVPVTSSSASRKPTRRPHRPPRTRTRTRNVETDLPTPANPPSDRPYPTPSSVEVPVNPPSCKTQPRRKVSEEETDDDIESPAKRFSRSLPDAVSAHRRHWHARRHGR